MPQLRAFAICPTCSELYPSFRGCPVCDGDPQAEAPPVATAVEVSTAPRGAGGGASEATAMRAHAPNLVPYVAALSVGVVVACGVLMALIAG